MPPHPPPDGFGTISQHISDFSTRFLPKLNGEFANEAQLTEFAKDCTNADGNNITLINEFKSMGFSRGEASELSGALKKCT